MQALAAFFFLGVGLSLSLRVLRMGPMPVSASVSESERRRLAVVVGGVYVDIEACGSFEVDPEEGPWTTTGREEWTEGIGIWEGWRVKEERRGEVRRAEGEDGTGRIGDDGIIYREIESCRAPICME